MLQSFIIIFLKISYQIHIRTLVVGQLLSCVLTLCDPMDYNLPGFSICGISQARILKWVAVSFSGGSSQPRD